MEIDIQCEGIERLLGRFQQMGLNSEPFLDRAVEKGAYRLQAEIKPLVPVDEGTLRNSISVEKTGHLQYSVGTNLEYAPYVEYGTGKLGDPSVPHTEKPYWRYFSDKLGHWVTTSGQPAKHFMPNGFENGKDEAVETVRKELLKWLT